MSTLNLYEILGLDPSVTHDADCKKQVQLAYIRRAKKYHPDKTDSDDAQEMFENITLAFETLSDTSRREKYDATLKNTSQSNDYFSLKHGFNQYIEETKDDVQPDVSIVTEKVVYTPEINSDYLRRYEDMLSARKELDEYMPEKKVSNMDDFNRIFDQVSASENDDSGLEMTTWEDNSMGEFMSFTHENNGKATVYEYDTKVTFDDKYYDDIKSKLQARMNQTDDIMSKPMISSGECPAFTDNGGNYSGLLEDTKKSTDDNEDNEIVLDPQFELSDYLQPLGNDVDHLVN